MVHMNHGGQSIESKWNIVLVFKGGNKTILKKPFKMGIEIQALYEDISLAMAEQEYSWF